MSENITPEKAIQLPEPHAPKRAPPRPWQSGQAKQRRVQVSLT
jgi:hypothetical protein